MQTPESITMERNSEEINYELNEFITEILPGTNMSLTILSPLLNGNFPLLLFQSGYGSNSDSHKYFLRSIARKGFIVVSVDRKNDLSCGVLGNIGFLTGLSCAAMSTDGSSLETALEYVKKNITNVDLNNVVMMGFSMGAHEAVHAQARLPELTKAVILVSGSFNLPIATFLGLNPCCYPCSGGNCTLRSDTPVSMCTSSTQVKNYNIPSLLITSENDLVKSGMYRTFDIIGGDSTLVTLKDSVLNLNIPNTKKKTSWGCFSYLSCYGSPFYGLTRHFAIANEEEDHASHFVISFLKKLFYDENIENSVNLNLLYDNKLNSKSPNKCCSPFPLFISCCDS